MTLLSLQGRFCRRLSVKRSGFGKPKWEESTFGPTGQQMRFRVGFNPGVNVKISSERPILPFSNFVFSADSSVAENACALVHLVLYY